MQLTDEVTATPARRPRWRSWLPRVLAVAVLVAAVVTLVRLGVGPGKPSAEERTATINAELVRRMTTVLEQNPTAHAGHGGHGAPGAPPGKTVCGARVYGYEPSTAESADAVVTVYGFHMCGIAEQGQSWQWATKFVAPLVMRFDTKPPTVQMAESSAQTSYRERINQLIPAQYQQLAVEGALEPGAMDELRRRYDAAAGV